jgi:hypothetical protein
MVIELEPGDFVYQADQELFLVVMEDDDDTYHFAVHGWRTIDKDRLDEYMTHRDKQMFYDDEIDHILQEEATEEELERYRTIVKVFETYKEHSFLPDGLHTDFSMDDE